MRGSGSGNGDEETNTSDDTKAGLLVLETDGIGELVTQNYSKLSILEEWEVDGAKWQV